MRLIYLESTKFKVLCCSDKVKSPTGLNTKQRIIMLLHERIRTNTHHGYNSPQLSFPKLIQIRSLNMATSISHFRFSESMIAFSKLRHGCRC